MKSHFFSFVQKSHLIRDTSGHITVLWFLKSADTVVVYVLWRNHIHNIHVCKCCKQRFW